MNWREHQPLAYSLRDQALADLIAARVVLRPLPFVINGQRTLLAHAAVSKSQQASEKLLKGWLLWHSRSFDPTKAHAPLSLALAGKGAAFHRMQGLCQRLNLFDRKLVNEIKWLEGLAPGRPRSNATSSGGLQPLNILTRNTEYPYWHALLPGLVTPGAGLSLDDALRALRAVKRLCESLSGADPRPYGEPIREFLEAHPLTLSAEAWPDDSP